MRVAQGLTPIDRSRLPAEVIAGVTLAALAIPEVMGYSTIAGMPVITGLYTLLIPAAAFALLGSSRHLVVGADSATAAILAAGLAGMSARASSEYVALAGALAIMAGLLLLLARLARLGFLADFLSRTVLIGFLAGVGVQVACGQVAGMLGVASGGGRALAQLGHALGELGQTHGLTVVVAAGVILALTVGPRLAPRVPWAIGAVIGAIVASAAFDLHAHGVATLGTIPRGLPALAIPDVALDRIPDLFGTALSMFVVILAQSAATSRAYASKFGDRFDENEDLVGLGVANLTAGLSGAYTVNGSPTKTEMVDSAGGRTQLAQLSAAAAVLLVLLFFTGPLSDLPDGALAALVFVIALRLVDLRGMRDVLRRRPVEFAVSLITALVVLLVGVQQGIVLAIALSVVAHLRHSYHPHSRLLTRADGGSWRTVPVAERAQVVPGLCVYRFASSLYYANAMRFGEEVETLVQPSLRWLCLVCDAMEDIDFSGSQTLREAERRLREHGVRLVLCGVPEQVRAELDRDGITERIGREHFYGWPDEVVAAYERD